MPESKTNFTENINQNKIKELKDYILSFKNSKDQIYDPKVYTDWENSTIFITENIPARWCVFRIYIKEKNLCIYNFSDEEGNVTIPNVETKEYDAEIIYTNDESLSELFDKIHEKEQQQIKKTDWKVEIGGVVLALIIGYISLILPNQIRQNKLQKEQELINQTISKPYVDFENYRSQIINKIESLEKKNPFIYVYTNDTEPLNFRILPNLTVYQNYNSYSSHFNIKQMQASDLKYFLDNEDVKGYNIWLNTTRTQIAIGNYNKDTVTEFNISMSYFHTKETKEYLKAKKRKRQPFINTNRDNIDSIQTARVIVSREFEIKPPNKLGSLLMKFDEKIIQSAIKKKKPTQKIYLSFYSKNGSKQNLESKIEEFEKLFYKDKKSKDYKIRKVYLKK